MPMDWTITSCCTVIHLDEHDNIRRNASGTRSSPYVMRTSGIIMRGSPFLLVRHGLQPYLPLLDLLILACTFFCTGFTSTVFVSVTTFTSPAAPSFSPTLGFGPFLRSFRCIKLSID